jgi:CrcB protein
MYKLLLVFVGGGVGSVLRYLIGRYYNQVEHNVFLGTFIVNITGSLIIGILFGLAEKNHLLSPNQTLLLATGFCGGFTTFSTFALENSSLIKSGNYWMLFLYLSSTVIVGLLAVFLGLYLATKIN